MISDIYSTATDFIKSNEFASGGLMIGMVTAIAVYLRNLPANMYYFIKQKLTYTIEILDQDPIYDWISIWMVNNYAEKLVLPRHFSAISFRGSKTKFGSISHARETKGAEDNDHSPVDIQFMPAPGKHMMWHDKSIMFISRERIESPSSGGNYGVSTSNPFRESIKITCPVWSKGKARKLIEDVKIYAKENDPRPSIYRIKGWDNDWCYCGRAHQRSIESVILPNEIGEKLLARIKKFLASKAWYNERQIPWRLGILIEGPPGTGKTSIAAAIANELKLSLSSLSITQNMDDNTLVDALCSDEMASRSLNIVEDIDCLAVTHDRDAKTKEQKSDNEKRITLSGLLNAIDGISSSEGRIIIMTTNHPEKIDPAILRPGRVDIRVKLEKATTDQAYRLYLRHNGHDKEEEARKFAEENGDKKLTMAELQQKILEQHQSMETLS